MKKILIVLIPAICLGQVFWENEVIDSVNLDMENYRFNAMALDTIGIPCVVYDNPNWLDTIMYAWQTDSGWQKENIESGFKYYGFSLVVDDNNIVHFSYYRRDDSLDITYHCCGQRDSTGWQIEYVDSTAGYLGNYSRSINSSIALDTTDLPGIAYTSWNVSDSLHYIKYAHYNGVNWDTSVVSYDSIWSGPAPPDWCPSLKFDSNSDPHMAFSRCHGTNDTLKYVIYEDSSNQWVTVHTITCYGTYPLSLALSRMDYPCIAYNHEGGLAYTWWDGSTWNTDYGIASIGWIDTRIRLALDSLDQPHILYKHWGTVFPRYCYKDTFWHMCGPVEPDTLEAHVDAALNLILDNNDQPHISYKFYQMDTDTQFIFGLKYAKGTFVGIEEYKGGKTKKTPGLKLFPNPCSGLLNIEYSMQETGEAEISVYDVTGARRIWIHYQSKPAGFYQEGLDTRELINGVYFVVLKKENDKVSKKFLIVK
ncbi:MAG: T9SS type A sorting domain-containing protein [bacterium]